MSRQTYYYVRRVTPWDKSYDRLIPDIMKHLLAAGAKDVWLEPLHGRSNELDVVLFVGLTKKEAENALGIPTPGVLSFSIKHVDWRRPE